MRKLAERTTQATKEIAATVDSMQTETGHAIRAMDQGTKDVAVRVGKTSASGEALQEIIQMLAKVGDMISEITAAANQQSDATLQVNTSLSQMSKLVQESSVAANQTASSCTDLSNLALDLRSLVNQFRLTSEPNCPNRSGFAFPLERSSARARTSAAAAGAQ